MDQGTLVAAGHKLIALLESSGSKVRAAVWIHTDADIWRLWIVPTANLTDKREFYRRVAEVISKNRESLSGLDVSDIEFAQENHPAIKALRSLVHVETGGTIQMQNVMFNDVYLPECIILQMAF